MIIRAFVLVSAVTFLSECLNHNIGKVTMVSLSMLKLTGVIVQVLTSMLSLLLHRENYCVAVHQMRGSSRSPRHHK